MISQQRKATILPDARRHAALTRNAGNIALLGMAGDLDLVPVPVAAAAADAYRNYRRTQHEIRLTGASQARVDPDTQATQRSAVIRLWTHVFGEPWR